MADEVDPIQALAEAHAKRMQEIADQGFADTRQAAADALANTKHYGGLKSQLVEKALEKLLTTRLVLLSAVCTAAFAVAIPTVAATPPPLGLTTRGTLVRVVDGDTVDVSVTYTVRVRLRDCWVPDDNEPVNEQAEEDLRKRAGGQRVTLHVPTTQARGLADLLTLNRVLGDVYHAGESLGAWQVKRGNASSTKNGALGK